MERLSELAGIVGAAEGDDFVSLVHDDPGAAIRLLRRNPKLSEVRSSWGETAMQAASHLGHRELIGYLLDSGCRLDLFAACVLGLKTAVRMRLVRYSGDSLGVHYLPILHFGIIGGDAEMVRLLICSGVAVNPRSASLPPLHSAVASGSALMVRLLLEAGANTDATDAFGATAVDWAVDLGRNGSMMAALAGRSAA